MSLYDEDTKLMAADTQQIKLWEFIHNKDDAPDLYSVLQVPLKVEQAFVNRKGDEFYQIITCKDSFIVYHNKLDKYFDGCILASESIKTIEFNRDGTSFYIGSDKGRLYKYNIESKSRDGEALELEIGQFPVDIVYNLEGANKPTGVADDIGGGKGDVFVVYVGGKGVRVVNYQE